jgi:RHS repeat-associated protein
VRQACGVTYLHSDHLGSVNVATNGSGVVVSQQSFDSWGRVRFGSVVQTELNYTGQRLDMTGLLYYHARMYDPVLARFASADSVVPGSASGSIEDIALKPLTVDFHEAGFVSSLNGENGQPFWFQMSDKQRQKAGSPWGLANAQALNRYSYVQNNPVRYVDSTGHQTDVGTRTWLITDSRQATDLAHKILATLRHYGDDVQVGAEGSIGSDKGGITGTIASTLAGLKLGFEFRNFLRNVAE